MSNPRSLNVEYCLSRAVVNPDEDVWRAYVPELEAKGVAAWGATRDEALRNPRDVAHLVIVDLLYEGTR